MRLFALLVLLLAASCTTKQTNNMEKAQPAPDERKDLHSYSNPEQIRVTDVALDLDVLFPEKVINGTVTLSVERAAAYKDGPIILDTRSLDIEKAESSADGKSFTDAKFTLGKNDPILGAPLTIELPPAVSSIRIKYASRPEASGLQWLTPAQTAGKKYPFLFSQGEAIHTRSWIPLQDTPGVRQTYSAKIRTPKELLAVMSAENDPNPKQRGDYSFRMPQRIPSYLIAIAVGDIVFAPMSERTGVYAERPVVAKAAKEFDDTEAMIKAAESLYGPYRWGRYDLLVLPPSFPFGGMENPRLTFATPTVLAGDKSLVSLVAHELAHSWSGNLVTNATWRDFWLNEGFTVYIERRIQEKVFGEARASMEAVLEREELDREMGTLKPNDQILHVDLRGRDPDDGFTQVPYIKGMLFLRNVEDVFGREKFDAFLKGYFDHFAFQSVTTADFLDYLQKNLLAPSPELAAKIPLDEWINKPGIPATAPRATSDAFVKVAAYAKDWEQGKVKLSAIPTKGWTTQEWLHFLTALPETLDAKKMADLDAAFHLTKTGNSEILDQWLLMAIRNHYAPADARLKSFLLEVGRRKYIKPLYQELAKTPEGKERAREIYKAARPGYHPIAVTTIDDLLK
ncbi:MAG: M1 family metallopeptidase [Bryobacteraceae bacterium]